MLRIFKSSTHQGNSNEKGKRLFIVWMCVFRADCCEESKDSSSNKWWDALYINCLLTIAKIEKIYLLCKEIKTKDAEEFQDHIIYKVFLNKNAFAEK